MKVWVTAYGSAYHSNPRCSGVGNDGIGRTRVAQKLVELRSRTELPCQKCWTLSPWDRLEHDTERLGDSEYEVRFVSAVLQHVPGLQPSDVTPQLEVQTKKGIRRIDFAIEAPTGLQVLVELDGDTKVPGEEPGTSTRSAGVKARILELEGWTLLSFPNSVVNNSAPAVEVISSTLSAATNRLPVGPSESDTSGGRAERSPQSWWGRRGRLGRLGIELSAAVIVASVPLGIAAVTGDDEDGAPVPPSGQNCPARAQIKGNINDDGEKIYHEPGWRYYQSTWPEDCFASPDDAEDAGFRKSGTE